jgi:hypothetical protein
LRKSTPLVAARLGTNEPPDDHRRDRGRQDGEHEIARDDVGEALRRCAAALRLRHHLHDLGQHGLRADLFGAHHEASSAIDRGADQPRAGDLLDRDGLAGQHRFVDARPSLDHDAVDGHLLAGTNAQHVADVHVRERDVVLGTVGVDPARGLRLHAEQRTNRSRGARARA